MHHEHCSCVWSNDRASGHARRRPVVGHRCCRADGAAAESEADAGLQLFTGHSSRRDAGSSLRHHKLEQRDWPVQLEAGSVDTGQNPPKQQVYQRIFNNDGSSATFLAGWFEWHELHNHFHFNGYADYVLQPVNAPGGSERYGQKTTFCVTDTTAVNTSLPGTPGSAHYSSCGRTIQGMSVGWGDTYGASLAGQEIDSTDNADGIYSLKIVIDPDRHIIENNDNDNESCVLLDIKKPSTVRVLDSSGSCSTVTAISPNSAQRGTTVQVTITGYGFTDGTTVMFEGGSGPRPVASQVQIISNADSLDMLTAMVTIPYKKQLGRNPVWDVRVGSGGVLRRGFTVTP